MLLLPVCRIQPAEALPCPSWLLQGWPERWSSKIRRIVASGLVAIGVLLALFAGVFRYVDQHFHTPETFLENTSELANNANVRERLFEGFRTEIIALADGDVLDEPDTGLDSLLDDDEDVLDPITEERIARDQAIEEVLLDVFDSSAYDQVFAAALSRTQTELITAAELEPAALLRNKGEVFFNMQPLYEPIWAQLAANEQTAAITTTAPPAGYGVFKVADRETTIDFLWTLLRNGPPHQLTPGELLESMMITSGAMTNRIDRLQKRGFVERVKDPTDGRQVLVTLTADGLAKIDAALVDHSANELAILQALDDVQRDQLVELLRVLHHAVVDKPTEHQ